MPLYDYKCLCGHEWEEIATISGRYGTHCPECGQPLPEILLGGNKQQVRLFPEGEWEHIGPEPLHISSKRELREQCKKHDCYAKYDDGYGGY